MYKLKKSNLLNLNKRVYLPAEAIGRTSPHIVNTINIIGRNKSPR